MEFDLFKEEEETQSYIRLMWWSWFLGVIWPPLPLTTTATTPQRRES